MCKFLSQFFIFDSFICRDALYKGLKPVLMSLGSSNFVYFYTFHGLKSLTKSTEIQHDLALGIIAGAINVLLTTPLWVVNSRLKSPSSQQQHFTGLLDGLVHIANFEGVSALWSGLGPSLILVSNPAIQFTLYEALKRRFNPRTAAAFFAIGAAAKAVATVLTYPLQLAQARQRHGGGGDARMSTAALLLAILKGKGVRALFSGLEAKLLQTVLTAALMFLAYEKIARFVFVLLLRRSRKMAV